MKISGSVNSIYRNTALNPLTRTKPAQKADTITKRPQVVRNKLNIPQDFKPQLTLNKKEQQFFENLYPQAQKKIRQYVRNQRAIQIEKGKMIDMKG